MSMSFLPSYLRSWIEAESSAQKYDANEQSFHNLQETIDEEEDWVIVNYEKNLASNKVENCDDLLQEYVVIEKNEQKRSCNVEKKSKKTHSKDRKKLRNMAMLKSCRYLSYVNNPQMFPKIAMKDFKISGVDNRMEQTQDLRIVPYRCTNQQCSPAHILEIFHRLTDKSTTAIVLCDSPKLIELSTCDAIGSVCVNYANPKTPSYRVVDKWNYHMMTPIAAKQLYLTFPTQMINKPVILALEDTPKANQFSKSMFEDIFIEDYRQTHSKLFSMKSSESLYSRLCQTKTKFENLLKSIVMLHFLVNNQLKSWKTINNMSRISLFTSTPTSIMIPSYDLKKPTIPELKSCAQASFSSIRANQMRRQNRFAVRNHVSTSNRQRGMKCGRFQSNVGRRETWH